MVVTFGVMRVHTFTPYDASKHPIIKQIKYKIYDYGDMCIIAFSSKQVECYRFVDRYQKGDTYIEVLEKLPIGYTPPVATAINSVIDIGVTKDPNVFVYGNYLMTVSAQQPETVSVSAQQPVNLFEQMSRPRNPTHTKQFKRKPLEMRSVTSIPLVMPIVESHTSEQAPKKIRPRMPMMSIPLMMPAGIE